MSGNTDWRTPPDTFEPLQREFALDLDVAASDTNALCAEYFNKDDDSLSIPWAPSYHVWCNPPYSPAPVVAAFVKKCAEHAKAGGIAVMLLNASTTDTRWFHEHIWDCRMHRPRERVEVRFLPKRIAFLDDSGVAQDSPRYSNMVIIFHPWEVRS